MIPLKPSFIWDFRILHYHKFWGNPAGCVDQATKHSQAALNCCDLTPINQVAARSSLGNLGPAAATPCHTIWINSKINRLHQPEQLILGCFGIIAWIQFHPIPMIELWRCDRCHRFLWNFNHWADHEECPALRFHWLRIHYSRLDCLMVPRTTIEKYFITKLVGHLLLNVVWGY